MNEPLHGGDGQPQTHSICSAKGYRATHLRYDDVGQGLGKGVHLWYTGHVEMAVVY